LHVLQQAPKTGSAQRRLLKLYRALSKQEQASLMAFAEFLAHRAEANEDDADQVAEPPQPKPIARPQRETVVAAIRRLSESYFMLDRQVLFHETAGLMSAHVLQGRPAREVIDELEQLFADHYQRLSAVE
jgi:hypothetical protein